MNKVSSKLQPESQLSAKITGSILKSAHQQIFKEPVFRRGLLDGLSLLGSRLIFNRYSTGKFLAKGDADII